MKKLILALLSILMLFSIPTGISAGSDNDGDDQEEEIGYHTIAYNGIADVYKDTPLKEGENVFAVYPELRDYENGQYFYLFLNLDNNTSSATDYPIRTEKTADGYVLTSEVSPGNKIIINKPGIYKYEWIITRQDGVNTGNFKVPGFDGELPFNELHDVDDESAPALIKDIKNVKVVSLVWTSQLMRTLYLYDGPFEPKVEISNLDGNHKVGDQIEFYVSLAIDRLVEGSKKVKALVSQNGDAIGKLEYYDDINQQWVKVENGQIGLDAIFAIKNTSFKLRLTVERNGKVDYHFNIADAKTNEIYATASKNIEIVNDVKPLPLTSNISCAGSKDKNCDGVVTCDEEKGAGWTWNNTKKVCEYTGKTSYQVVNTGVK